MTKFIILSFILLLSASVKSQNFKWQSELEQPHENGFYDILVTPEISSKSKKDLSDIRIIDSNNSEIGYLMRKEVSHTSHVFKNYTIVENKIIPSCCTQIILQNPSRSKINNIHLDVRNSAVDKTATLSGSDDGKNWYSIKNDYYLTALHSHKQLSRFVFLDFPWSNYEFYKIEIKDSTDAPVQILKAGYFDTYQEGEKYLELPLPNVVQKDSSDKHSYIYVTFSEKHHIDKIDFQCEGPKRYFRNAQLFTITKNKSRDYLNPITETEIISGHESSIKIPEIFTNRIVIIVENKDNAPLKFTKIKGLQLMTYLTTSLEKNRSYVIKFGNDTVQSPQYDLQYFKDSIPENKRVLIPKKIQAISSVSKTTVSSDSFFKSSWWIWGAILLIGGLLAYMSFKMVKEMKA